jgi:hypothetical protein
MCWRGLCVTACRTQRIEIVSLATPFLRIIGRPLNTSEQKVIRRLPIILFLIAWIYSDVSIIFALSLFSIMFDGSKSIIFLGKTIGYFTIFFGIAYFLCRKILYSPARCGALANRAEPAWQGSERLLVLRAIDDEAAMSLAAGSIANRVAATAAPVLGLMAIAMSTIILFLTVVFPAMLAFPPLRREVSLSSEQPYLSDFGIFLSQKFIEPLISVIMADQFDQVIGIFSFACLVLIACVLGIPKVVYGRELFTRSFGIDLDAHSAPDSVCNVKVMTLSRSSRASRVLQHAIYEHPDCVPTIMDWIESNRPQA